MIKIFHKYNDIINVTVAMTCLHNVETYLLVLNGLTVTSISLLQTHRYPVFLGRDVEDIL